MHGEHLMLPSSAKLKPKPASHRQAELPGSEMALAPHSRQAVAPEAFMNAPAGQSEQADEADVSAYFPAMHSVHSPCTEPLALPASQASHRALPSPWKPGWHEHRVAAASFTALGPTEHSRQAVAPEALTNLPAGHPTQLVAADALAYVPASHAVQSEARRRRIRIRRLHPLARYCEPDVRSRPLL